MATNTATRTAHGTLTSTTVDTVTLDGSWVGVLVTNRDPDATSDATLWVTTGATAAKAATPVAEADETFSVLPGQSKAIYSFGAQGISVKILGDGNAYSVEGLDYF